MSEWEPATDAEVAMRDALRTDDQESYFRILAGVDLLLPVSADALAGLAPLGWGTWSTGGRTHVLAFTSPAALQACLADYTGSARRVAYAELADTWPNLEWWLAVNPGLPIEGYLPAWFVAQLSRGDLRLPTRGPVREGAKPSASQRDLQAAAMAANAAAAGDSGGPIPPAASPSGVPAGREQRAAGPANPGDNDFGRGPENPGAGVRPAAAHGGDGRPREPAPAPAGYAASPGGRPGAPAPGGGDRSGPGQLGPSQVGADEGRPGPGGPGPVGPGQVGPGGLPIRTPGAVLPSGLPSRVPAAPQGGDGIGGFSGFATRGSAGPDSGGQPAGGTTGYAAAPVSGGPVAPAAYRPADLPAGSQPDPDASGGRAQPAGPPGPGGGPSGAPGRSGSTAASMAPPPSGPLGSSAPPGGPSSAPAGRSGSTAASMVPASSAPPSGPAGSPPGPSAAQDPRGPLPTRTPMAQTPPLPSHLAGAGVAPAATEPTDDAATTEPTNDAATPEPTNAAATSEHEASGRPAVGRDAPDAQAAGVPDAGSSLPRRQVTPPGERPASMAAAAQALAASRAAASPGPAAPVDSPPARPGLAPPVIPGAGGSERSDRTPFVPAPSVRPEVPPTGATAVDPAGPLPALPPVPPAPAAPPVDRPAAGPPPPDSTESTGASRPGIGPGNSGTADDDDFVPANPVEQDLYNAADVGSTDSFLSTLLLATVLVPVADNSRPGSSPGESGFAFRTEELDDERFLVVFTSRERLSEHFAEPTRTVGVKFLELIRNWPDPDWSFAVNPNTPVGAKYPGPQVIALASWATEAGLGADPEIEAAAAPAPLPQKASDAAQHATVMQKTIPAEQVDYYLERGYDRVAGFVHRANEVEHLRTPAELFAALGLVHDGSPYQADAKEAFVLRWPAYRPSLYRIPYGGQSEQALRAMDGWVIERPPFRGNGFAPGEGRDVVAEFKVDSVRLPHGAQLWRMDADGNERMIAVFDCDAPNWRRVGEH